MNNVDNMNIIYGEWLSFSYDTFVFTLRSEDFEMAVLTRYSPILFAVKRIHCRVLPKRIHINSYKFRIYMNYMEKDLEYVLSSMIRDHETR